MPLVLQQTQWDCLRGALISYFSPLPAVRPILVPLISEEALSLVEDRAPLAWADWTVSYLRAEGFSRASPSDNPPIIKLLKQFPGEPEMETLLRIVEQQLRDHRSEVAARQQQLAGVDPFCPIIMRRRQPLLARAQASSALQALARADDAAAYVVHGPEPKSGCSYTAEVVGYAIETLALAQKADIQVASVEYSDEIVDRYEAVSYIASSLVQQIDSFQTQRRQVVTAPPPPPPEPTDKWLHALAQWLLSAAANTGEAWWLVLDRLPTEGPPSAAIPLRADAVDRFIQILVRKVARLSSANRTRLIVLSYPSDFPTEIGAAIVREELPQPSTIGQAEVEELFRKFFATRGGADPDAVTTVASMILDALPTSGHRLINLNTSIRDTIARLTADSV